ncbi:unnamed protein product [Ilex paraguariensis]|uniref:Myb-like domain-containing protein n=1 Tax=Ilex paraguariensis TaxID=185542 RepID=A0ABC8ULG2_9AQUA
MFDGVPDQFHQFIASRTSLPIPFSFPLHEAPPPFPSFDPYPSHQRLQVQHPHLLHQLDHQSPPNKDADKEESASLPTNLQLERERSMPEPIDPWSNDEVLALLRIRSSMENWFPQFTWEHVSRKLAEMGFKRSAENCKEKYEEESRQFNNITYKNYRIFSDLEDLYHGESPQPQISAAKNQNMENPNEEQEKVPQGLEENSRNEAVLVNPSQENEKMVEKSSKCRKRKRKQKIELFKCFCLNVVNKMIAQQEELHNKLLEDMVKRDEEKIAREEAWKKQEMDRINKEIEDRAHEQAIAGDRQATIIEFLKKYTSSSESESSSYTTTTIIEFGKKIEDLLKVPNSLISPTSPSFVLPQNPISTGHELSSQNKLEAADSNAMVVGQNNRSSSTTQKNPHTPISVSETLEPQNPISVHSAHVFEVQTSSILVPSSKNLSSSNTQINPVSSTLSSVCKVPRNPNSASNEREDIGKRWPRDEVSALINLRCSLTSNVEEREGAKGPLWERISQGMLEWGYKRSAKRCKEKWENINKYFRKTKDENKKRSLDSRTCPYFHQLSSLYSQGTLVFPSDGPENRSASPENHSAISGTQLITSQGGSSEANTQVAEGGNSLVQAPGFNF